jgi:AcrR family transcriptional regulator
MDLPSLSAQVTGHTRQRLIEAARELFHARGYRATSLAAIVERAGVQAGSLYYFFKTKEDLLVAVLERYAEMLGPVVLEPAFARTDDPLERVFAVLDGYRRMLLATDFAIGCPIGNLVLELRDPSPRVRQALVLNLGQWSAAVEACLEQVPERLEPGVDRAALSRFVLTVMEGAVLQARAHRSIDPFDRSVERLRDYFRRLERRSTVAAGGRPARQKGRDR